MRIPPEEAEQHDQTLALLRLGLSDERVSALLLEGRDAPFDELVAVARELFQCER